MNKTITFDMDHIDSPFTEQGRSTIVGTLFVNPVRSADQTLEIVVATAYPTAYAASLKEKQLMHWIAFEDVEESETTAKLTCTTTIGDMYKYSVR